MQIFWQKKCVFTQKKVLFEEKVRVEATNYRNNLEVFEIGCNFVAVLLTNKKLWHNTSK